MSSESRPQHRHRYLLLVLLVPLIAVLVPEIYNFGSPSIGGMPFFYWWQLLWVPGVAICTAIAYRVTRRAR